MRFRLEVDLDNSAFDDDPRPELYRIVAVAIGKVSVLTPGDLEDLACGPGRGWSAALLDVNGNGVGEVAIDI